MEIGLSVPSRAARWQRLALSEACPVQMRNAVAAMAPEAGSSSAGALCDFARTVECRIPDATEVVGAGVVAPVRREGVGSGITVTWL